MRSVGERNNGHLALVMKWCVVVVLLVKIGGGTDDICACMGDPVPTCTQADSALGKPCSNFCNLTEETAVFTPSKSGGTTGNISCKTVTTTSPTTTPTTTAKGGIIDDDNITVKNKTIITRCETGVLTGTKLLVAKIFSYISFVWIFLCVFATIVANFKHKNKGHHRLLHLFQEIFILILWLFMGIFNLTFRTSTDMCKATSIIIHICIGIVAAALVFEAIFADSMVHNKSYINGKIPAFLNYLLPIVIGLIPALITYFIEKKYYLTGLHCFAEVPFDMFWGFVVPVWILLYIAGLKASLGNLACDLTDEDVQDEDQIFWSKKSCKALFFFSFNLLTCYLLCLFGSSQQRFILFIFFFLSSLLFGPIIFITHTYCHRNSQRKFYGKGLLSRFYKPCPPKHVCPSLPPPVLPINSPKKKNKKNQVTKGTQTEPELSQKEEEKKPEMNKSPPPSTPSPNALNTVPPSHPPLSPRRPSFAGSPPNWPNSREFYGWMGGKNKYDKSQDALFMPKPR